MEKFPGREIAHLIAGWSYVSITSKLEFDFPGQCFRQLVAVRWRDFDNVDVASTLDLVDQAIAFLTNSCEEIRGLGEEFDHRYSELTR